MSGAWFDYKMIRKVLGRFTLVHEELIQTDRCEQSWSVKKTKKERPNPIAGFDPSLPGALLSPR